MAVSAFKSTSKRGNLASTTTTTTTNPSSSSSSSRTNKNTFEREISEKSPKKPVVPLRRSRSVSALSRTQTTHLDVASEFLNKRDNPLFWSSSGGASPPSPPDDGNLEIVESENAVKTARIDESRSSSGGAGESRRGRSVSRNVEGGDKSLGGNRKEIGRSLSRVDTGRRGRSVSVRPASRHHSESEVEQECSSTSRNSNNLNIVSNSGRNVNTVRNSTELVDGMRSLRTWSSQHPSLESSDTSSSASCLHIPNWEHGGVMNSSWEDEEKTIKAVSEQTKGDRVGDDIATSGIYETVRSEVRRAISDIQNDLETAIRRNNTTSTGSTSCVDAPVDSVNPGAVELVLDIRREYAKELEQSHERARKLRADLAVEEHRGQELSRILKELLPEPKTSNLQRSRPARKSSIERRKMSKSLAEEAMTYFDECVSISTFDSSDFSSQEDPPINLIGATALAGNRASLPRGSSTASTTDRPDSCLKNKEIGTQGQPMHILQGSGLTASTSGNERNLDQVSPYGTNTEQGWAFQFSFGGKPTGTFGLQRDISNYVKSFEKAIEKDGIDVETMRSNRCDVDDYNLQVPAQSFLLDRVIFKNRIESGSLLLCGSFPISISPFASIL